MSDVHYGNHPASPVANVGDLVTYQGVTCRLPCKVLRVRPSHTDGRLYVGELELRATADRGPYSRGEVLRVRPTFVSLRRAV
jgi:hypothetical protein